MKSILLALLVALGIYLFAKTDAKDRKARKEAQKVTAVISKLQCKQRLKGDKSFVKLKYQSKKYTIHLKKRKCENYILNQEVTAYYSKTYDKIFLEL